MASIPEYLNLQGTRYFLATGLSVCVSLAGILYAAYRHSPESWDIGQRGGAWGVSIALVIFFARKNLGETTYRDELRKDPSLLDEYNLLKPSSQFANKELTRISLAIDSRFNIEAKEITLQNIFLAIASFVGTIVWGFGDWFAYDLHKLFS